MVFAPDGLRCRIGLNLPVDVNVAGLVIDASSAMVILGSIVIWGVDAACFGAGGATDKDHADDIIMIDGEGGGVPCFAEFKGNIAIAFAIGPGMGEDDAVCIS